MQCSVLSPPTKFLNRHGTWHKRRISRPTLRTFFEREFVQRNSSVAKTDIEEQVAMATTLCTLPTRVPVEALASCTGRTSHAGVQTRANVHFPRVGRGTTLKFRQNEMEFRVRERKVHCAAEGDEGKSCCGGSGGDGGQSSGKCSSHGSSMDTTVDTSGIGKEFEALVAQKTMQQFEAQYETGQMEGTISRDVMSDVINIYPEAASISRQEKFLDVDELLAEARALSSKEGEFIFDADFEDSLV